MGSLSNQIRHNLIGVAKHNEALRDFVRWTMNITRYSRYKLETAGVKVDEKTIIFACFGGRSYTCSPKALYEYMQTDDRFSDYTFVWAFVKPQKYICQFEDKRNTIVIKYNSASFRKYLAKAKYWIFNYKVDDLIKPKENQVFVQCWHGTPLKKLGCDLTHLDNALNSVEGMKKRYRFEAKKFDYFLSPSAYASEKFISAWDLENIGKQNVIVEQGYPRNDFLYNYSDADVARIKREIFKDDIDTIGDKRIILYAPTFRNDQHSSGKGYVFDIDVDMSLLKEKLANDYVILFRSHYFVSNHLDLAKYKGFVYDVSRVDDINSLYVISDMLVTDYSSVMFDYANLKRPMIFYMYDMEHYRDESNGFYFNVENELPGNIARTEQELIDEILSLSNGFKINEAYENFNKKYNYLDDGNASKRVVEHIFFNK